MLRQTSYLDQSAHVPLFIKLPRQGSGSPGQVVEALTESIDLIPIICEFVGVSPPANYDGSSLLGFCHEEVPANWRDGAHWSFDFREAREKSIEGRLGIGSDWYNLQVVGTKSLRYVDFASLSSILFDLEQDPLELFNRVSHLGAQSLLLGHGAQAHLVAET